MKITREQLTDLFYLLVIAAVCFKLLYAVSHVMDIRFYDETSYLARGLDFNSGYLFKDGFIYFVWYKFLSLFAGDAVTLYYFNYAVLFVLNPLLLYFLLRKMGKSAFVGTLFAVFLAVSNLSIITWPFITRFAVTIILAMFLLIFSVKSKKTKYLVALGGLALLIYTRPEYVLSLVIFAVVSIVFLGHKFIKTRGRIFVTLALVTLVLSLFIVFVKNPAKTGRSVMAFGQHYAEDLYQSGKISIAPNTNWKKVMKENFGTDSSILKAFFNNPGEMARHVFANINRLPLRTKQLLVPYTLYNRWHKRGFLFFTGLLLLVSTAYFVIEIKKKTLKGFFGDDNFNDRLYYLSALVIFIPLLISIFFIYTREHYLLVLFTLLAVTMAKNLPAFQRVFRLPERFPVNKFKWVPYLLTAVVLFWVPWRATGTRGFLPQPVSSIQKKCSNLYKLDFIKNLKVKGPIVFLGTGGPMTAYLENFKHVYEFSKDRPFNAFVEEKKINMILVNKQLIKDTRFREDEEFKAFLAGIPDTWKKIEMPACKAYLAVRKALLHD